jgi:DNA modification methylase
MLILADARRIPLADGVAQCVITSPPYWGLRDYGTATWEGGDPECAHLGVKARTVTGGAGKQYTNAGSNRVYSGDCACGARRIDRQIGLESTPDAYVQTMVQVFREVWRVLRDDGVLFLNLGDSYAAQGGAHGGRSDNQTGVGAKHTHLAGAGDQAARRPSDGLKPKDLVGIPWSVAKALQAPFYTGSIRDERDRIWLAAMLDAEGCLFIHRRKAGQHNGQGYFRQNDSFGPGMEISNTSTAVVERIQRIVGKGSICSQGPNENARRKQTIYRWNLRTTESRDLVRELYPHLVAKQQQARILYGCPSSGERAEAAHAALIALHRTGESGADFPVPPSMFEPGYYLRSDIIWSKCNPMPESVTDRPTKAHEYVFLLSKSERYYWDAEAVAEPSTTGDKRRPYTSEGAWAIDGRPHEQRRGGQLREDAPDTRNIRSVWAIPTRPYADAHFATMPPALAARCIKAGSRPGDLVFDPFGGSGTTAQVAVELNRRGVLLDLNQKYLDLARQRTSEVQVSLLEAEQTA